MRQRVVDHFLDHPRHSPLVHLQLGSVQVVDHLDDAFVLAINDLDTGVQITFPLEKYHLLSSPRSPGVIWKNETAARLEADDWRNLDANQ
ncbi:hypothetical protein D9M68_718480 [compost metagenome]